VPLQVRPSLPRFQATSHVWRSHIVPYVHDVQDAVGDGWMYTIWAGLVLVSEALIVLVMWRGGQWREAAEAREKLGMEQN